MRRDGIICLALLVTTLVAFWPVGQCDFINHDDPKYVVKNKEVQAGLTSESVRWAFTTAEGGSWNPLTWLSHMATCQLFGLNAAAHHWVNLGFHVATALLLFLALRQITGTVWRSAFVAALFALHPLHVESVAWVSARKDVLSGLFAMLTLWAYAKYAQRQKITRYLLALFFFALGLMSKPMLVTLPFILLLLDFWPLGRFLPTASTGQSKQPASGRNAENIGRLLFEKLPFLALAIVMSVVTYRTQGETGYMQSFEELPLEKRIPNAIVSCLTYLAKMFWPKDLAVFYPYHDIAVWQTIGAGLLLFGVSGFCIWKIRARSYLFVGWFWFIVMLLPVIGLVQVGSQSMADRYTYLPLIGLFLFIVWGISYVIPARPFQIGMASGAALTLLACLLVTRSQLKYWQNSTALFGHALEVTTRNALAHNNLGQALAESGNKNEAAEHFRAALDIFPNNGMAHNNLGAVLIAQGEYAQAEAHLRTALELRPNLAIVRVNLGLALALQGKNAEAQACFVEALRLDPHNASLHRSLANVFSVRGNISKASSEYAIALKLDPMDTAAREGLALLFAKQRRFDEAMAQLDEALKRRPTVEVHTLAAAICAEQGNLHGTVQHYRQALLLEPNSLSTMNNLAWLLATNPEANIRNGSEAVGLAQKACELSEFKRPVMVGTLAAAYAETGRFDEAIKTAEAACALAAELKMPAVLKKNQELLELYRAGHPYHESQGTNRIDQTTGADNSDNNAQSP